MAMSESWFEDTLVRKYWTSITLDGKFLYSASWKDGDFSYPGPKWHPLDLLDIGDTFQVRIYCSGTDQAPLHQIVIYRKPVGETFGKIPIVGVRLKVTHKGEVVCPEGYENVTWHDQVDSPLHNRIRDSSIEPGYQEYPIPISALLDNESFQKDPSFEISFEIRIRMNPQPDTDKICGLHAVKLVSGLASMLKDPSGGNIEFVFPSEDGSWDETSPRLYAFSSILGNPTFQYQFLSVESSGGTISEPSSPSSDGPSPSPPLSPIHRTLLVKENYDLFHLVLFYIYTNKVHFVTSSDLVEHPDEPSTTDAEGVYGIAHRYLIKSLQVKSFHFMKSTCNVQTITERTFHKFASLHPDIGEWYEAFFMKHWEDIRVLPEFEKYFVSVENDHEEYVRISKKFRRMMRNRIIDSP